MTTENNLRDNLIADITSILINRPAVPPDGFGGQASAILRVIENRIMARVKELEAEIEEIRKIQLNKEVPI